MTGFRHLEVRADWLAQRVELPLDPGQPVIDAHHHLWAKPGDRYLAGELMADIASGPNVVATVFVEGHTGFRTEGPEPLRVVGETELAVREAEAALSAGGPAVAAGIVARADLLLGEAVGEVLDAHAEAGRGRFRGIRYSTPWHPDPAARGSSRMEPAGLLYDPALRRGLREVERRGLVFDAWMYHSQLGDLVDLARAMPDLRIVLNHLGGPIGLGPYAGRRDEVFADWLHWTRRLAALPNLTVKLGGLGMRLSGFVFGDRPLPPTSAELAEAWAPYVTAAIEAFGADRAMFESNFPVDKGMASYAAVWNAFARIAAPASKAERHGLFFGTANRAYGLGLADPRGPGPARGAR